MLDERELSHVELEVDGGIKAENAANIATAGATILVVGSAIYNSHGSIADNFAQMQRAVTQ
jgi:ribulose-phosphate 3-epimerase